MAPVVQINVNNNNSSSSNNKSQPEKPIKKPTERRPELLCRVKYCNTLPDIPFDPKFIVYPFDTNRFVEYKQTSLEKNFKHDLLTEQDLGVTIDLINPETYDNSDYPNLQMEDEDEKLLEDEVAAPQDTKRSRCHNRAITWLKKTEYISTEFNRYGASSDKNETKVGFGVKKKMNEETLYLDRQEQIRAINKTFESAQKPILSHPGKPGVKPVEILPIFPDFDLWKYPFSQVMFDADPVPIEKLDEMSHSIIRGVNDTMGIQYVAYFLPTEDTLKKRKEDLEGGRDYTEEMEYEYYQFREYNWNVKNKATRGFQPNHFFIWKNNAVFYNELETRVKLSKRRSKPSQNSILVLKHRELDEAEFQVQQVRLKNLGRPHDDEPESKSNQRQSQAKEEVKEPEETAKDDTEVAEASVARRVSSDGDASQESSDSDSEPVKKRARTERKPSASDKSSSSSSSESSSSSDDDDSSGSSSGNEAEKEIFGNDDDDD